MSPQIKDSPQIAETSLSVKADHDAPRISRSRIAEIRTDLEPRFDDVVLAVSELVTNSVRHAGPGGLVQVSVMASHDTIRLEVTDEGPCFDAKNPKGDGLGLRIIDAIADDWGVESNGACTVWVEITRAI